MTAVFEFEVNGEVRRVTAQGALPLMLALRHDLGLAATRQGCSTGHCGACTVLLAGNPVAACSTPLEAVAGQKVETIEAFAGDPIGKALLSAFIADQAGQCGYCLAGILIAAKALLARNPRPARAEIRAALDGNLCRCGAHTRIVRAIERAAATLATGTRQ